jgi:hypothetical protein
MKTFNNDENLNSTEQDSLHSPLNAVDRDQIDSLLHDQCEFVPTKKHEKPCLIPQKFIRSDGSVINKYVDVGFKGNHWKRHILAFFRKYGRLPKPGMVVCHACDRKSCGEPEHMLEGTPAENIQQASERGLLATGDDHWTRKVRKNGEAGIRSKAAKLNRRSAGEILWCWENVSEWYSDRIIKTYAKPLEAIAAWYDVTVLMACNIARRKTWKNAPSIRPKKIPFEDSNPDGRRPVRTLIAGSLTDDDVIFIRSEAQNEKNLTIYVKKMAEKYGLSIETIWKVLHRQSHTKVADWIPAIPRQVNWNTKVSDTIVRSIRATFQEYSGKVNAQLLRSGMAKYFGIPMNFVTSVCSGVIRQNVGPGDFKIVPLEELNLSPNTLRGTLHPKSKLSEADVLDILKRSKAGEKGRTLAAEYGVSEQLISRIRKRKCWSHLQE